MLAKDHQPLPHPSTVEKRKHINLFCYQCGDPYDQPSGAACCHANHEKDWSSYQFAAECRRLQAENARLREALTDLYDLRGHCQGGEMDEAFDVASAALGAK